ncbi:MAG TPA: hypothetical protein VIJ18_01860 [Microbacteriaceae bacterium]
MSRREGVEEDKTPRCPKCGRELEPEPFDVDGRTHIAYRCPRHGVEAIGDDAQ